MKKSALFFLGGGGFLAIVGGFLACCFNCRWYIDFGDNRRVYKGPNKLVAQCALSSGIIAIVCAAVGLIGVLLTLCKVRGAVIGAIYITTLFLYIGEMIPEAIILEQTQWGIDMTNFGSSVLERLTQNIYVPILEANWYDTDPEFRWWVDESAAEQEKYAPVDEYTVRNAQQLQYFIDELLGYYTATSYHFLPETVVPEQKYAKQSCIIDYNVSTIDIDYVGYSNCSLLQIETVKCVGGWSGRALTNALRNVCNTYLEILQDSIVVDDSIAFEGAQITWAETADAEQQLQSSLLTEDSIYSLNLANQVAVAIQTVGFALTLMGTIMFPFSDTEKE